MEEEHLISLIINSFEGVIAIYFDEDIKTR